MTTAALGARDEGRLVYVGPPAAGRGSARRALLGEIGLLLVSLALLTPTVLAVAGHQQAWLAVAEMLVRKL